MGRNLIGSLLPVAIPFLRGFAAEYPWGTVFGVTDDEEESSYGIAQDLPTPLVPAWSEIVCEWEYDSSRTNSTIHVPSRRLLDSDLRWNGIGGFAAPGRNAAFVDPPFGRTARLRCWRTLTSSTSD